MWCERSMLEVMNPLSRCLCCRLSDRLLLLEQTEAIFPTPRPSNLLFPCWTTSFWLLSGSLLRPVVSVQLPVPQRPFPTLLTMVFEYGPSVSSSISFHSVWATSSPTIFSQINSLLCHYFPYHNACSLQRIPFLFLTPVVSASVSYLLLAQGTSE